MFLEERTGPHLERIIGVSADEFDKPNLRRLARGFVAEVGARYTTGTLWIVTSAADSERVQGVRATGGLYADWRHEWMQEYRTKYPVARVSVIDGSARLELRMPDGGLAREVLRGADPFIVNVNRRAYEIIYLLVFEIRGLRGEGPVVGYKYNLMLCARDGARTPLDESVAVAFSRRLRTDRLQVSLHMNTWLRHANIPTVYPFELPVIPPKTLKEASPFESWCGLGDGRVECRSSP
jgi:hypothetical protein